METTCEQCSRVIPNLEPAALRDGRVLCRVCDAEAEPTCPVCGNPTGRALQKSKGKCKSCGTEFRVDRDQCLFPSVLLTADQASWVTAARGVFRHIAGDGVDVAAFERCCLLSMRADEPGRDVQTRLLRLLFDPDIAPETPVAEADHLRAAVHLAAERLPVRAPAHLVADSARRLAEHQPATPDPDAIVWDVLEQMAQRCTSHMSASELYDAMAAIRAKQEGDYHGLQREARRHHLLALQHTGVTRVRVETWDTPETCRSCRRLAGSIFTIDQALATMPLPCPTCSNDGYYGTEQGFCRCEYYPVRGD